ncbi:MAG: chorismate synthase [Treponema sp.]|jgi:chorismate synthase|nr:chorismate synthase [Treponema sp.]
MSSVFGNCIKISIFGQSHSESIGVVIDGLKAGFKLNMDEIYAFMKRRAPGQNSVSTPRAEADEPHIISGLVDNITCGAPLCAIINNTNVRSKDYSKLKDVPRPAHSDLPAFFKHSGFNDIRGGGHFSARLTAPLCFAGAVCMQFLKKENIHIGAHIFSIKDICDKPFDNVSCSKKEIDSIKVAPKPLIDQSVWHLMEKTILDAKSKGDSVGGIIECACVGLKAGIGEPMFDGIENKISQSIFAIPAVKGIEFGRGFESTKLFGSENNDSFYFDKDNVLTKTNNHGGILGGLSSGMPIMFKVAFKPTPSISKEQDSVNLSTQKNEKLKIEGRHDPCVVVRAVPCVEAATAIAIYDLLLESRR